MNAAVLLCWFQNRQASLPQAMKTSGRGTPNRWAKVSNRAHGVVGQSRSCSFKGAGKQEKFQPQETCFFLTSPLQNLPDGMRRPVSTGCDTLPIIDVLEAQEKGDRL